MNPRQFSDEQIFDALDTTCGRVYLAAAKLGCHPSTIYRRAEQSEPLAATLDFFTGRMLDIAEDALMEALLNREKWAVLLVLKTKGRSRGYGNCAPDPPPGAQFLWRPLSEADEESRRRDFQGGMERDTPPVRQEEEAGMEQSSPHAATEAPKPVRRIRAIRTLRKAIFQQRRVKEFAGVIASERTSGAVGAAQPRREAHDQKPAVLGSERSHRGIVPAWLALPPDASELGQSRAKRAVVKGLECRWRPAHSSSYSSSPSSSNPRSPGG